MTYKGAVINGGFHGQGKYGVFGIMMAGPYIGDTRPVDASIFHPDALNEPAANFEVYMGEGVWRNLAEAMNETIVIQAPAAGVLFGGSLPAVDPREYPLVIRSPAPENVDASFTEDARLKCQVRINVSDHERWRDVTGSLGQ